VKKLVAVCVGLLAGCGGKSTADWIAQLRARDGAERLRAIKALGQRKSEAATVVPALAQVLRDEDAFVRRDAARALGEFGAAGLPALPSLRPLLQDRNAAVRKAAAQKLRKIDPEGAHSGVR
jgi:hypothetical protein